MDNFDLIDQNSSSDFERQELTIDELVREVRLFRMKIRAIIIIFIIGMVLGILTEIF